MSVKDQEELPLGDQPAAPKKKKRKRLGTTSLNKTCQTLLTSNPPAQDVNKTVKPSSVQKIWQGIRTPTIQFVREIKQESRKQIIKFIAVSLIAGISTLGTLKIWPILKNSIQPKVGNSIDEPDSPSWSPTIKLGHQQ